MCSVDSDVSSMIAFGARPPSSQTTHDFPIVIVGVEHDEDVGAAILVLLRLGLAVIEEHVPRDEEVVAMRPALVERVDQQVHLVAMPLRLQGLTVVAGKVFSSRRRLRPGTRIGHESRIHWRCFRGKVSGWSARGVPRRIAENPASCVRRMRRSAGGRSSSPCARDCCNRQRRRTRTGGVREACVASFPVKVCAVSRCGLAHALRYARAR